MQNAIKKAEKALAVDPQSNAYYPLASAYFLLGDYELFHGGNPIPALQKVTEIYRNDSQLSTNIETIQNTLGLAFLDMAEYKLQRGENPNASENK